MQEKDFPLEWAIEEIKRSITQYSNGLCQKYQVPPAVLLQILQEIIYENQVNSMAQMITKLRMELAPKTSVDIKSKQERIEDDVESQSNDE